MIIRNTCVYVAFVNSTCLMQGHAGGLQLQLELVLKSEQWAPSPIDPSVQKFLQRLFPLSEHERGDQCQAIGDPSSPDNNGSKFTSPKQLDASQQPDISGTQPTGDSISLADALESAVNSEEAAQLLQAIPRRQEPLQAAGGMQGQFKEEASRDALHIGEMQFVVAGSAGLLLQHVEALLAFGHANLSLRYEMATRVAALVRFFDTCAQELLLGAAAISSAGLRSITARHMSVCSQCLLLLEVVLPRLRSKSLEGLSAAQVASLATIYESVSEVRHGPVQSDWSCDSDTCGLTNATFPCVTWNLRRVWLR